MATGFQSNLDLNQDFNEIRKLILDNVDAESDFETLTQDENQIKVSFITRSDEEFAWLLEKYGELFEKIDSLVE